MSETRTIRITSGDSLHTYGSIGTMDYTVRLSVRLDSLIDGEVLKTALESTQKRYPYLKLRMKKQGADLYYEENPLPVCLFNTDRRISLNCEETNYHIWAVCYKDDYVYLDFYHGICDGTGMYMVLSTLLYYYIDGKYGNCDSTGIRTLEDPIDERESIDPTDSIPPMDPALLAKAGVNIEPAFSLISDGETTLSDHVIVRDVMIPDKELLKFTSENDASPGTFLAVIIARAIEQCTPVKDKELRGSYVINARPMLDFPYTHHNCVNTVFANFSDRFMAMPIDRQCTAMRGMTILQSDRDRVSFAIMRGNLVRQMCLQAPTLEARKAAFGQSLAKGTDLFTFMVSYVGQWKYQALGKHIVEFWTHVPAANNFLVEIAAVKGSIFLSFHQRFEEDKYYKAVLKQLEDIGIPYIEKRVMENDISYFPDVM